MLSSGLCVVHLLSTAKSLSETAAFCDGYYTNIHINTTCFSSLIYITASYKDLRIESYSERENDMVSGFQ